MMGCGALEELSRDAGLTATAQEAESAETTEEERGGLGNRGRGCGKHKCIRGRIHGKYYGSIRNT